MRKLKFDLSVETNALLCPNPEAFYSKAYITENVINNFRTVPGVKESTKLAKNTFDNVLQSETCTWSATDSVLDAVDITVCKVSAMVQICQYDLENSYISMQMAKGDANWEVSNFMNSYWEELGNEITAEIQDIRWNGNTDIASGTTSLCDGYIKTITGSTATQVTGGTIVSSNIIDAIISATTNMPEQVKGKKADIRIYMSATNALLFQIATLSINTNFNYTGELDLKFAGYEIAVQESMSNDFIVIGNKNNFVYAFDGEGDASALKAVNLIDTVVEPIIRTRAALKLGFHILNEDEIVYYEAL